MASNDEIKTDIFSTKSVLFKNGIEVFGDVYKIV